MEIKKSPKADLEKDKGLSLLLGFVVAISVVFVSLEWRSVSFKVNVNSNALAQVDIDEALIIEDQKQEEPPKPEPPKPEEQEVQLPEEIKVVDNDKEVKELVFVSNDEEKPLPPPVVVEEEETEEIFTIVEDPCEFPGGMGKLNKYLRDNIEYPEIAQENGIQGRVIVEFVVEKNGKPSQVKVLRGVDPALDKEAIRVVKNMPAWKPGKQQGKPVRQRFTLPVVFRLM